MPLTSNKYRYTSAHRGVLIGRKMVFDFRRRKASTDQSERGELVNSNFKYSMTWCTSRAKQRSFFAVERMPTVAAFVVSLIGAVRRDRTAFKNQSRGAPYLRF